MSVNGCSGWTEQKGRTDGHNRQTDVKETKTHSHCSQKIFRGLRFQAHKAVPSFAPCLTAGFSNPCPGGPEEVRLCRGPDRSTRNVARGTFSKPGPAGWTHWAPWASVCSQGKQWRTRTCNKPSDGKQLGVCSGPSSESRVCDGARANASGQGSFSAPKSKGFNICDYFSMPALC